MSVLAEDLRKAIDNLIDAKLHDALRPGGIDRLIAHRTSGVSSPGIRAAEQKLDEALVTLAEKVEPRKPRARRENYVPQMIGSC